MDKAVRTSSSTIRMVVATAILSAIITALVVYAVSQRESALAQSVSMPNASQTVESPPAQVLIKEIKELRNALEKVISSNTQNQFLIERTRLQQSVVNELHQEQKQLQESIESDLATVQDMEEVEQQLQKQISIVAEPTTHGELEQQLKRVRQNLNQMQQRLQRNRERIAQVKVALDQETATFNQLKTQFQ